MAKYEAIEMYSKEFFDSIQKINNSFSEFNNEILIYYFGVKKKEKIHLFYVLTENNIYFYKYAMDFKKGDFIFQIKINSIKKISYGNFNNLTYFYILLVDNTVIPLFLPYDIFNSILNNGEIEKIKILIEKNKKSENVITAYSAKLETLAIHSQIVDGNAYLEKYFEKNKKIINNILVCNKNELDLNLSFNYSTNFCIKKIEEINFNKINLKKNYDITFNEFKEEVKEINEKVNYLLNLQNNKQELELLIRENRQKLLENVKLLDNQTFDKDFIYGINGKQNIKSLLEHFQNKANAEHYLIENYGVKLTEASRLIDASFIEIENQTFNHDYIYGLDGKKNLKNIVEQCNTNQINAEKYLKENYNISFMEASRLIETLNEPERIEGTITYIGGHPDVTKEGITDFKIVDYSLVFEVGIIGIEEGQIAFKNIQSIHFETTSELQSRITLTRLALLGPLGLFLKKHKSTKLYYLSIDAGNYTVLFSDEDSRKLKKVYQKIYYYWDYYKKNYIEKTDEKKENKNLEFNNYDELIKLKELLDAGIITQDDYDKKKKILLNL